MVELEKAISTDIGVVLSHWIANFPNQCDSSFYSFQSVWNGDGITNDMTTTINNNITNDMTSIPSLCNLIYCCPGLKYDRSDQKIEKIACFTQIIFSSLLSMLFKPSDDTIILVRQKINSISRNVTDDEKDIVCQCLWNIGVLYTMNCLYHTQHGGLKTGNQRLPIRLDVHTYMVLLLAVERVSCLSAALNIVMDAELLVDKMERDQAFCIGSFTGYRNSRPNDDVSTIDLNGIANGNKSCRLEKFVNIAKHFLSSPNHMSIRISANNNNTVAEHVTADSNKVDDVQLRRKAYKEGRKASQEAKQKIVTEETELKKNKQIRENKTKKDTVSVLEKVTPVVVDNILRVNTIKGANKKRLVSSFMNDNDSSQWTDPHHTSTASAVDVNDIDDFFGVKSTSSKKKKTVVDSNINDLMKVSDTYDDNKDKNNDDKDKNNENTGAKPEKQRKKKVKKEIELLTSLINSQT